MIEDYRLHNFNKNRSADPPRTNHEAAASFTAIQFAPCSDSSFTLDWTDDMDTDALRSDATADLPRAGFWRRWAATLIDTIVVLFPFQVIAAILFVITAGTVQMNSGFFSICEATKTIPQQLAPPPPHDSNAAKVCRTLFFGATTGAILTVGRVTREGTTTTTVSQSYALDKDGNPTRATSIDGIVWLAFLAFLIAMVWKTGKTVGARIVGTRVVDITRPGTAGVPLGKAIIRYLVMIIGACPAFALLLYRSVTVGGSADVMFTASFFQWFMYAGGLGALWVIVLIVQIARKSDPIYDRLAGTAVLRHVSVEPTEPHG